MKRIFIYMVACLSIALMFTSCEKDEESFDETLLIGEWKGTEIIDKESHEMHYKYMADHNGITWDASADMAEEDGQGFTWSLDKSDLTHIHVVEIIGENPVEKTYKVTELTPTSLKYEESIQGVVTKYSYTKVTL